MPVPVEAVTESVLDAEPAAVEPEVLQPEAPEPETPSMMHGFLTPEESSVFAEESGVREPRIFGESNVFAEEEHSAVLPEDDDPFAPRE
ncbi:MAG: hypothetical protein ABSG13_30235 [Bryobacteraceae bacterium]